MEGLIAEGKEMLEEDGDPAVIDAALIASSQRVEHYEMAGYGCVRTLPNFSDTKRQSPCSRKRSIRRVRQTRS
jgi:ferritin-like metal-binding protein YciE